MIARHDRLYRHKPKTAISPLRPPLKVRVFFLFIFNVFYYVHLSLIQSRTPLSTFCKTMPNPAIGYREMECSCGKATDGVWLEGEHDPILRESRSRKGETSNLIAFFILISHIILDVGFPFLILWRFLCFIHQNRQDIIHTFRLEQIIAIYLLLMYMVVRNEPLCVETMCTSIVVMSVFLICHKSLVAHDGLQIQVCKQCCWIVLIIRAIFSFLDSKV